MSSLDKAVQTQINNIQKKTGKTLDELAAIVKKSGLSKHGEIREMLMEKLGLGHGDANSLVHAIFESDGTRAAEGKSTDAVLDEIYSGPKAAFRPVHEKLMKEIHKFGDFEIVPKKGYVSLRRKKQFAMIGPKTNTRFEVVLMQKNLRKMPACWSSPTEACAITLLTSATRRELIPSWWPGSNPHLKEQNKLWIK